MVSFREFLKHEHYLDSISTIFTFGYWIHGKGIEKYLENLLASIEPKIMGCSSSFSDNQEKIRLNLKNSWYHESAMQNSINTENVFIGWSIIQMYYSIYCSLSALVRLVGCNPNQLGQSQAINFFNKNILDNEKRVKNIFPPLSCHLIEDKINPPFKEITSWKYGLECHCPNIHEALCYTKEKSTTTNRSIFSIIDYLKVLREWCTYTSPEVLKSLYGTTVKDNIYSACSRITAAINANFEYLIINKLGFDVIKADMNNFLHSSRTHLNFTPDSLENRFNFYNRSLRLP